MTITQTHRLKLIGTHGALIGIERKPIERWNAILTIIQSRYSLIHTILLLYYVFMFEEPFYYRLDDMRTV